MGGACPLRISNVEQLFLVMNYFWIVLPLGFGWSTQCNFRAHFGLFGIRATSEPTIQNKTHQYNICKESSENLEFEKPGLKRKMKFHGVKNIEKKILLY